MRYSRRMLRSRLLFWLSVFIFPPLGLVLLWMRGDWGVFRKLAATVGIAVIAFAELIFVYGMRIEMTGGGELIGITFKSRIARHDAQVEESRARQMEVAPVPVPAETVAKPAIPVEKPKAPAYWTDFRGPNRAGVYAETGILTEWPAIGLQRLWKQP